jgi:hypothetical protein
MTEEEESMTYYKRLEIPKRDLQRKVEERIGMYVSDPEVLVALGVDAECEYYDVYEDYDPDDDDDDGPVIIVECYCRRRPRRQ